MSHNYVNPAEKALSFEQLPQAIGDLIERVGRIEQILLEEKQLTATESELLDLTEAVAFLRLTKSTIYSKVCRGELPAFKTGRRLYFDRKELTDWIRSSRKRTNEDIRSDAQRIFASGRLMPADRRRAYRR